MAPKFAIDMTAHVSHCVLKDFISMDVCIQTVHWLFAVEKAADLQLMNFNSQAQIANQLHRSSSFIVLGQLTHHSLTSVLTEICKRSAALTWHIVKTKQMHCHERLIRPSCQPGLLWVGHILHHWVMQYCKETNLDGEYGLTQCQWRWRQVPWGVMNKVAAIV